MVLSYHALPANCTEGTIRLIVGEDYDFYRDETDYDATYYIGDDLSRGRVEICKGGGYHTICLDLWDEREASVVCQELGFSPNGKECDITTNVQFTMTIKAICWHSTFLAQVPLLLVVVSLAPLN